MATFIKVTQEGNELLRRNKEQTQGQRLNKLESDEQRRVEQQARELRRQALLQQGLDASGNVLGGGRRQRFRPDEPAASYLPQLGGMSHVFFEEVGFDSVNGYIWKVWPVSTSSFIQGNSGDYANGFYGWSMNYFVLPVQRDVCVFVVYGLISGNGEEFGNKAVAYLVSKTSVRVLQIPANLQGAISLLNSRRYESINDINGVTTSEFAPREIKNVAAGFYQVFFNREWTPVIYELLNKLNPFTPSSSIKQFPSSKRLLTRDIRYGAYADTDFGGDDPIGEDRSLYYAEWTGPLDLDTRDGPQFLIGRPNLTTVLPSTFTTPGDSDLIAAWDWDDPAYCRQMCLALGFSAADLTP